MRSIKSVQCWHSEVSDGHLATVRVTRPTGGSRGRIPAAACAQSSRVSRDSLAGNELGKAEWCLSILWARRIQGYPG